MYVGLYGGLAGWLAISSCEPNEINTAMFLLACGFAGPNHLTTMTNIDNAYGSGLSFFHNVSNLHDAEAQTAPHIDSVTEIGLAVEPIVQGPDLCSCKLSRIPSYLRLCG